MKLEGKTALVTGAGRGIGREIALAFAREGATLGINDLTEEGVAGTVGDVESMGREALALPADKVPPTKVTATRDQAGQPRSASTIVGTVVINSSSMMRGLVRFT